MRHAGHEVMRGGLAGIITGVLQVFAFMWLRAIMNHQYYHGGSVRSTARQLYREGGIARFYQGLGWALLCTPAARFGDTFVNTWVIVVLGDSTARGPAGYHAPGQSAHTIATTAIAAAVAACWRVLITPLDTMKTATQVQGDEANRIMRARVDKAGIGQLWSGMMGNFCAHYLGCYPWWATYNTLEVLWVSSESAFAQYFRLAVIGAMASIVSDCCSNAPRVVKTIRQCHPDPNVGYIAAANGVLKVEGIFALFYRGIAARMTANVLQGSFFAIVWNLLCRIV